VSTSRLQRPDGPASVRTRPPVLLRTGHLADVPADDEWLGPLERDACARLRVAKRRREWRLGRWTAKQAILAWLPAVEPDDVEPGAMAPNRIQVVAAADGAPDVLVDGRMAPVVLSLSHSAGLALAAVALPPLRIGCDVERVEERSEAFVDDVFTAAEAARIRAVPSAVRPMVATMVWSAKESALKALRQGLRLDTRAVEVAWWWLGPGTGRLRVRHAADGSVFQGSWWRQDRHVATLLTDSG
jgi:4'-phosphopantetheinyl transferase